MSELHYKTGQVNKEIRAWAACEPLGLLLSAFCEAHPGHAKRSIENVLTTLLKKGELFNITKPPKTRYFATVEQREAARPILEAQWAEEFRAMKAAQNKRRVDALRITRGTIVKPPKLRKPASGVSQAVVIRGIAHLPGEADMSRAKVTRAPTPPGRYAVPEYFRGAFSMAGIGRYLEQTS